MRDLSDLIFDLVVRTAPADRAEWLSAMKAELEFVPRAQRLRFASGCVAAALVWRFWTPQGVRKLAQGSLFAASATLAMVAAFSTMIAGLQDGPVMMLIPAIAYGFGAFATGRWGLRGMVGFACCGILANSGFVLAWTAGPIEPSLFLRALTLEALFILAAFLSLAAFAQILIKRMERRA